LEHVIADETMIKGGEKGTPYKCSGPLCSSFEEPSALYLYIQISNLGQFRLSEKKRKDYKELKGNIYKRKSVYSPF
jgi:hypothetical protein